MTKEEYKRNLIRMFDSLRDEHKGEENCIGVACGDCPLYKKACGSLSAFEAIEFVEKWTKEHPIKTNEENMETKEKCPICEYEFEDCQCPFGGTGHPDRSKRARVIADHIYLFTDKQIEHLKKIQKRWSISYVDEEKNQILKELESGE